MVTAMPSSPWELNASAPGIALVYGLRLRTNGHGVWIGMRVERPPWRGIITHGNGGWTIRGGKYSTCKPRMTAPGGDG